MTKKYTLVYFNVRGRAEPARLMFAYKGVEYEDRRLSQEEWQKIKPQTPCQQLPVLEVDGETLPQSLAIARYLGNEFGLVGKNNWENAKLDAAVGCVEDCSVELRPWFIEKDQQKKTQIEQELKNTTIPNKLKMLECCALGKGNKFILGDKPTWADFVIAGSLELMNSVVFQGQMQQANKNLADYCDRVHSLPGVKEWVAKRPNTPM